MAKKTPESRKSVRRARGSNKVALSTDFLCEQNEIASALLDRYVKITGGSLPAALKMMSTSGVKQNIQQALDNYSDDLIGAIIDTKVDFYGAGFTVQVPGNKPQLKARVYDVFQQHDLPKVCDDLMKDFAITDNAILYWEMDGNKIKHVASLSPARVDYFNALGSEKLTITLSTETLNEIRAMLTDRKRANLVTPKYREALTNGGKVELSNDDNEYWIVSTKQRKFAGLAIPSMSRIFFDIVLRRLLISGDWTLAYFVRRVIEAIKIGEKAPASSSIDPRRLYPTTKEMNAIKNQFTGSSSQAMRIFANHTFTVDYFAPDKDLFTVEKFTKVEERILRWGGVIDTLMTGKGDSFAEGMIGVRRFTAHGKRVRRVIGGMFESFFRHPTIQRALKVPSGIALKITWDEQNLKDAKQVMDEVLALYDRGAMDVETMHQNLGYRHDVIKARKAADNKTGKYWWPVFEEKQGLLAQDGSPTPSGSKQKRGRPLSGNPPTEPKGKPRPSRTGG